MTADKNQAIINLLHSEWELVQAAVSTLKLSVLKCQLIGIKDSYSFEELESFDSLTSKFNRTSDIFTQKALRSVWILLHEPFMPFIDMMNKCEKMAILSSSDQMIEIRDLRNQIAHEYLPDAIRELIPETIELSGSLIENIETCKLFIESRGWFSNEK